MASGSMLAAILVLAVVILVHELGHFLVAKWCDVEVKVFSMGFGPTVASRQAGETTYRLALVPLGGYVRMAGFEDEGGEGQDIPSDPARGFTVKPLWQRAAIIAAGPAVNLVFAAFLFAACALAWGVPKPVGTATIDGVAPGRPAATAGLRHGDTVVAVDGRAITQWDEMVVAITASEGRALRFEVADEAGARRTVDVTPARAEQRDPSGKVLAPAWQIGVSRGIVFEPVGIGGAAWTAIRRTWMDSMMIVTTFGLLVTGQVSAGDLGGPIMVVSEASRQAQHGIQNLLLFMALISINLGVVNLLPIPVLDGGHLAFMAAEAVRGQPLSLRVREVAMGLGLALIGTLMIFVVFHDIVRLVVG